MRLDRCVSALGVISSNVAVAALAFSVFYLRRPSMLTLVPMLFVTIPLIAFPFPRNIVFAKYMDEAPDAIEACATFSLLSAIAASLTVVISTAIDPGTYQPTDWPVNPFHYVSVAFATSIATERTRRGTAWLGVLSLLACVVANAALALNASSIIEIFTILSDKNNTITDPTPVMMRVNRTAHRNDGAEVARFIFTILCMACEITATLAHMDYLSQFDFGSIGENIDGIPAYLREGCVYPISGSASTMGVASVCATLVAGLFADPRGVVMDSSHVILIACVLYLAIPRDNRMHISECAMVNFFITAGLACSTYAVIHTAHAAPALGPVWLADVVLCCVGLAYQVASGIIFARMRNKPPPPKHASLVV